MRGLIPDRIRGLLYRGEAVVEPTTAVALLKLQNLSTQLSVLGANVFTDEQPDVIEQDGRVLQHKRKFVYVGGYAAAKESDLVRLLQPLFPDLKCLVSFQEDAIVHRIEVFCGEK